MDLNNVSFVLTQNVSFHPNMSVEDRDTSAELSSSEHDSEGQHLSIKVSFALSFVTLIFAVTGAVTNSVSLFLYTRPAMRSSMNILLAGLAAFDLAFSILSIPTFVAPPMCVYRPEQWIVLCNATTYSTLYVYPLTNVAKTGGVWTLVYITVQRWFTVRRPFRRARGSSFVLAKRALFAIFVAAALYNSPRFFEHQLLEEDSPKAYIRVKEYLRRYPIYMSFYYSILYLLTHFIIPFTVLAFINGTMTCAIRRALKQERVLSHSEKAAAMMATVVFVFVFCNTLPFVMNFVEFIDRDLWVRQETKVGLWVVNDISNILLLVSATSNAFIYYYCNQKYAQILKRYLLATYQLAKDRFNRASDRPPTSRYRMVTSNGFRRPAPRRRYYQSQSPRPSPPLYAVYHAAEPDRAYFYLSPDNNRRGAAPFDASPKRSLITPARPPCRKRSRSVLASSWRTTSRLRSGTGLGRSFSSTALTMADHQGTFRLSLVEVLLSTEAPFAPFLGDGRTLDAAMQRPRGIKNAPTSSTGSLV